MNRKELDKNKDLRQGLSKEDLERLEILQNTDKVKGEKLFLNFEAEFVKVDEAERLLAEKIDDPVQKFQLYYNGLSKLLLDNLPKGKEFEDARRIIYDEKNILINRGAKKDEKGIRGSDGRMAYTEDLEKAIKIVADWLSVNGTMVDLYMAFWNKNAELGYGHQD